MMVIKVLIGLIFVFALIILAFAYLSESENADYLIVLGCKLDNDRPVQALIDRIDKSVSYLMKNPGCKVIVSGGITQGNTVSEAQIMHDLLVNRGIETERIIMEQEAKDTYENFYYAKKLLDKDKRICFCSSDYHILRSRLMALKNGLNVSSICSRTSLKEKLIHLPLEEYFIISNLIKR